MIRCEVLWRSAVNLVFRKLWSIMYGTSNKIMVHQLTQFYSMHTVGYIRRIWSKGQPFLRLANFEIWRKNEERKQKERKKNDRINAPGTKKETFPRTFWRRTTRSGSSHSNQIDTDRWWRTLVYDVSSQYIFPKNRPKVVGGRRTCFVQKKFNQQLIETKFDLKP